MRSMRACTFSPVFAERGMISSYSPSFSTTASCASTRSAERRSILLSTATTGVSSSASSEAMKRSPLPMFLVPSSMKAMASTSEKVSRTALFSRSPRAFLGLWKPGVSTKMTWASSRVYIQRILFLVVWGFSEMMASLRCMRLLRSVDLPTLGRPTMPTKPDLYPFSDSKPIPSSLSSPHILRPGPPCPREESGPSCSYTILAPFPQLRPATVWYGIICYIIPISGKTFAYVCW